MKNSTFVGLSALVIIGTGAAYWFYRKKSAPARPIMPPLMASNPSMNAQQMTNAGLPLPADPAMVGVNAADMIAAGLPLPAGFAPVPAAPMHGLQLVSNRQLNTRSKNGVAGMGSFMTDVEAVAKFSAAITEASILPFDKNLDRKVGARLKALPGMHNVNLVGPLKPKVSAPPAATPDTSIDGGGYTGTGNGVFQNAITAQVLEAAPSLLQQYAGQPVSILPLLIAGSVTSASLTDPATGLPSSPSSPGSAQTYGWPAVWTPVPGYSPWQYMADQPVGGATMLPTAAGITPLPVTLNPATGPGGVATPTNVAPKKATLNPLVMVGTAIVAVPVFFLVGKK
jgi:hypothetical protein